MGGTLPDPKKPCDRIMLRHLVNHMDSMKARDLHSGSMFTCECMSGTIFTHILYLLFNSTFVYITYTSQQ